MTASLAPLLATDPLYAKGVGWVVLAVALWTLGLYALSAAIGQGLARHLGLPPAVAVALPIALLAVAVPLVRFVRRARQRFTTAVAASYETLSVSLAAVPALERAAQAANANYEQADARFKAGLGSSVELADAEALRLQAEVDLAIGRFEQGRARARLARALAEGL